MNEIRTIEFAPPKGFSRDIEKAIEILRREGCREIYLFGSILIDAGEASDIDMGIRNFPRSRFFHIYGLLMAELEHSIDLLDFDQEESMFYMLQGMGEMRRIA